MPERFELTYIGSDGEYHRPVVIHRGVVSTMERFVAFLTEETKGAFPTWLAPKQVEIIPVNVDLHYDYARNLQDELKSQGVRVEIDDRNEKWVIKYVKHKCRKFHIKLLSVIKRLRITKLMFVNTALKINRRLKGTNLYGI